MIDYVPNGLTIDGASVPYSMNGNNAVFSLPGTIQPGASTNFVVNFIIDTSFTGLRIKNVAEISQDNGDDCDSTPDTVKNNDGTVVDNDM